MTRSSLTLAGVALLLCLLGTNVMAQDEDSLVVRRADWTEVQLIGNEYVVAFGGNVEFVTRTGQIFCDSAEYRQGRDAWLRGNVFVDDSAYSLRADSVYYELNEGTSTSWGDQVELWSFTDSIYATGTHAVYNRQSKYFYMDDRPTLYLRYPDTVRWVEVIADTVIYTSEPKGASAIGQAIITSAQMTSSSGRAEMNLDDGELVLTESPVATHGNSEIAGSLISIGFEDDLIQSIVVNDSASGSFMEPLATDTTQFDESTLTGKDLHFEFEEGQLARVLCRGQARSWYRPSSRGSQEFHENEVAGDTIWFVLDDNTNLEAVEVFGSAVGSYLHGRLPAPGLSEAAMRPDTVDYASDYILYHLADSLIVLRREAAIKSGTVNLSAREIVFDTQHRLVEAYSAAVPPDSTLDKYSFATLAQPSAVPVMLVDGTEELVGDYLEYSLDTEKGRIVQSKIQYDPGYYYGEKLFRERDNIFYIRQGRFTTCEHEEPHFHFRSTNLKLIEGDRLVARPVVAYVGRLPVMALPYFVFPLKKGRHSGFLDFEFGNFERDVRFIKDLGYYWAASEYWDWLGALDYYDNDRTFTVRTKMNFAKRYVIKNTWLQGEYTRKTSYNRQVAQEGNSTDFTLRGNYEHQVTPSLNISGYGHYVSSSDYYSQYSNSLEEHLEREIKSQVTVKKEWGSGVSLTSKVMHTVNLDQEWRRGELPRVNLSLPTLYPFGSGQQGERKWYHDFNFRYSPSMIHQSNRDTKDTGFVYYTSADTTFLSDTAFTVNIDTTSVDTLSYRTRKRYGRIDHSPALYLPKIKLGRYLTLVPKVGYLESWYYINQTDQSDTAGIDPTNYRTYTWNAGLEATTKLYGTVAPNILGLTGLRHIISPTVAYRYSPEIDLHPEVRRYAGGGAGSSKSSVVSLSIAQDFMARVNRRDQEKAYTLFSLTSSLTHNFENHERPYGDLSTNYRSDIVPSVSIYGSVVHELYEPGTNNLSIWSPYLKSFSFNASMRMKGSFGLFGAGQPATSGATEAGRGEPQNKISGSKGDGSWSCQLDYRYGERGRGSTWSKTADDFLIRFSLNFNLTDATRVSYSQTYDIRGAQTLSNTVRIERNIHCWSGSLYWVPTGSTRGFGFKLFVTGMPDIKIDNGHDSFMSGIQSRY